MLCQLVIILLSQQDLRHIQENLICKDKCFRTLDRLALRNSTVIFLDVQFSTVMLNFMLKISDSQTFFFSKCEGTQRKRIKLNDVNLPILLLHAGVRDK